VDAPFPSSRDVKIFYTTGAKAAMDVYSGLIFMRCLFMAFYVLLKLTRGRLEVNA
jgi:hypothetical protein